jgi:predicted N-formylglutamate amidohydrolase
VGNLFDPVKILITCEHGGNKIPTGYRPLFRDHREALQSHRGYDPGALSLARDLARVLDAELVFSTTSRLLVELNRSPNHRQVLSDATRGLSAPERERLMQRYYWPYRNRVEAQVSGAIQAGERVAHISSHSFTPRLHGITRRADVGLLYDPSRDRERELCTAWRNGIMHANPALVVRRNYPYRGTGDGVTTHLRKLHGDGRYAGIELEVNQKHTLGEPDGWRALRRVLVSTLQQALKQG